LFILISSRKKYHHLKPTYYFGFAHFQPTSECGMLSFVFLIPNLPKIAIPGTIQNYPSWGESVVEKSKFQLKN
jgi:hypothetical protein